MRIVRVKHQLHKFISYHAIHYNARTRKQKLLNFINRPVLTNLHKFVTHISVALWYLFLSSAHLVAPQGHGEHDPSLLLMPKLTIQSE